MVMTMAMMVMVMVMVMTMTTTTMLMMMLMLMLMIRMMLMLLLLMLMSRMRMLLLMMLLVMLLLMILVMLVIMLVTLVMLVTMLPENKPLFESKRIGNFWLLSLVIFFFKSQYKSFVQYQKVGIAQYIFWIGLGWPPSPMDRRGDQYESFAKTFRLKTLSKIERWCRSHKQSRK